MAAPDAFATCPSCGAVGAGDAAICATCGQAFNPSGRLRAGYVVADRYEIRRVLGEGGMGTVYEALDRKLEDRIALKLLKPDFANSADMERRFRHEIKLARKLRHPNVCAIHEYGESGPLRYIAMELIEGTDLKRRLRDRGALPTPEGFKVAIQIAQGLDCIHKTGVVHRDLKASNVMLDRNGDVRLMDFGIAKQLGAEATLGATAVGSIIGTPEYMSPEQGRGETIDCRSDLYSLGIVVYEIFTGDVPFRGDTPIATLFKTIQDPVILEGPVAQGIPAALKPVLLKALAKTAPDRFATAEEMTAALVAARDATLGPGTTFSFPPTLNEASATLIGAAGTLPGGPPPYRPGSTPVPPTALTPAPTRLTPPTVSGAVPGWQTPAHGGSGSAASAHPVSAAANPQRSLWPVALMLLGIVVVIGGGGAGLYFWLASSLRAPTGNASAPLPTGEPSHPPQAVQTTPSPALTPFSWSSTPAAGPEKPPASVAEPAKVAVASVPTSVRPTPPPRVATPAPRARPTPAAMAAEPGQLQLYVKPWADVIVDGQPMGTTPLRPLTLAAGTHRVQLKHPAYSPLTREVVIAPGNTSHLEINLPVEGQRLPQ